MLLAPLFKQTNICALTMGTVGPSAPELHSLWWDLSETYFPHAWSTDVAPARAKPSMVTHQERLHTLAGEAHGACTVALRGGVPDYPWAHSNRASLKRGRQEKATFVWYCCLKPLVMCVHTHTHSHTRTQVYYKIFCWDSPPAKKR